MATTTISINLNTPVGVSVQDVLDTLCTYWAYDSAGSQTKAQFVKTKLAQFIRDSYISAKAQVDVETARQTAINTASQVTVD